MMAYCTYPYFFYGKGQESLFNKERKRFLFFLLIIIGHLYDCSVSLLMMVVKRTRPSAIIRHNLFQNSTGYSCC